MTHEDEYADTEGSDPIGVALAALRSRRSFPTDEELRQAGWVRISRRSRQIESTPRVGQYFWVDFPHDAYPPEFVDEHPGIVVRAARALHDTCIIVPITSQPQKDAKHIHKLANNPNPRGEAKGISVWAVCDHLYTVHINRLRPIKDRYGRPTYPRASAEDLEAIFAAVRSALHRVFSTPLSVGSAGNASGEAAVQNGSGRERGPNTLSLPNRA